MLPMPCTKTLTTKERRVICVYPGIEITEKPDGTITLNEPHLIDSILHELKLQSSSTEGYITPALSSVVCKKMNTAP
jgi:hypothetical protein